MLSGRAGARGLGRSGRTLGGAAMDAEAALSYSLEQVQALYSFPFQQMMAEVPNMAVTTGQQVPAVAPNMATVTEQQVPVDAPVQEPAPEAPKRRKRKPRAAEPQEPVEPKKPATSKKSGKSTKSKEKQEKITDAFKVKRKSLGLKLSF